MANKTANVTSRMPGEIKEQAEAILARLGIPHSVAIDIYYRQIIAHNGIPFPVTIPNIPPVRSEMSDEEFGQMMAKGLEQAKKNESYDVDEVFAELKKGDLT